MGNNFIHACAGAGKSRDIVEQALSVKTDKKILITTYTRENCRNLTNRLFAKSPNFNERIIIKPWFTFLLSDFIKPFRKAKLPFKVKGLLFVSGQSTIGVSSEMITFFISKSRKVYSDKLSRLACKLNETTNQAPIKRLEIIYDRIFIDEFQDFSRYDFNVIDGILLSKISMMIVGDIRQQTYKTAYSRKNINPLVWAKEKEDIGLLTIQERNISLRCNKEICEFASKIYPELPPLESANNQSANEESIVMINESEILDIYQKEKPQVLRLNKSKNTLGLAAKNMKGAKGLTFEKIMIFPTDAMLKYITGKSKEFGGNRATFYVAVTRAMNKIYFVIPSDDSFWMGSQLSLF